MVMPSWIELIKRTRPHQAFTRGSSIAGQSRSARMQPNAIAKINVMIMTDFMIAMLNRSNR